jgi:hypothetical protein
LAPDNIFAMARHHSGAKEYDSETHSPFVLFGLSCMDIESIWTFFRLEIFSLRASGLLVFFANGYLYVTVPQFYLYFSRTKLGKKFFTTSCE